MDKLPDFKKPAYNTDGIINKLVTVFAFTPAFKPGHYFKTNPDPATAVKQITTPGLNLNRLANLYRDRFKKAKPKTQIFWN
jgi:hypothetical protein